VLLDESFFEENIDDSEGFWGEEKIDGKAYY
jgi:hypothetical protein